MITIIIAIILALCLSGILIYLTYKAVKDIIKIKNKIDSNFKTDKMKKVTMIAMLLFTTLTVWADGFINTPNTMYYGRKYKIQYIDDVPTESLQYFYALSQDGTTWTNLTDTLMWYCPDTAEVTIIVNAIGYAELAIFTNPNGIWDRHYSHNVEFKYSNDYELLSAPDTIFSGGSYNISLRINKDQAPEKLILQYSTDNGSTWLNYTTLDIDYTTNVQNVNIDNGNNLIKKNTIWRVCYDMSLQEILRTTIIPYKERETYFHFKTKGGQKEIGDKATLMWEKSYNFSQIEITTTFDNEVIDVSNYYTDGIEVNFAKNGEYTIVGVAKDENFSITKTLTFTVGDPCSLLKAQAVILRDSIETLNRGLKEAKNTIVWADSTILKLNKEVEALKCVNITQNNVIDSLKEYILVLKADSLKIQLIYNSGCVNEVKDETFVNNMQSIYANLTNEYHIYIAVPEELQHTAITWWCFDGLGNFVQAESTLDLPDSIIIKQGMSHGVYFWYALKDGVYKAYKFVI